MEEITVGVLTVSDRCDRKEAVDESGPNLVRMIGDGALRNGSVARTALVSDSREDIEKVLREWSESGIHLILTTGGTGVGERDVTPEATMAVLEKTIPGIPQLIFKRSSEVTPLAALSRGVAGVRGKSLIINLPGSKKASKECLEAVAGVIPHAVDLINGRNETAGLVHALLGEEEEEKKKQQKKKSSVAPGNFAGRKRKSEYPCISVKEAQTIVMDRLYCMRKEKVVCYEDALGHTLAQDVVAGDNLPPFDASLKDGYAVLSSDKMRDRNVMAVSHAGGTMDGVCVFTGHCVRVSTGAPIPPGADAVVQVEDTTCVQSTNEEENTISLGKLPTAWQDIRRKGTDFKLGQRLLKSGEYLNPPAVGLLAAAGVTSVIVYEKPLVAIISTGDELVSPGERLGPGKVRDSNGVTLRSLLKEDGFEGVSLGIVPDEPDALRDALERGFRTADVVVTSGSMSMGERDYLKEVLVSDFGAEICFGRVLLKPGKPTSFGMVKFEGRPKLWFGLPGNPASVFVTAHLFLLPALRRISGQLQVFPVKLQLKELMGTPKRDDRPQYLRASLTYGESTGTWTAVLLENQGSSCIKSCANANGLVYYPASVCQTKVSSGYSTTNAEKNVPFEALLIDKVSLRA